MGFINRQVAYPNKKKLIVLEIKRGYDGEIESLVVSEERQDGSVTNTGTQIEADAFKTIIEQMIEEALSN